MFHTWSRNAMRYLGAFVAGLVVLAAVVLSAQRTWSSPETAAAPAGVSLVLSSDQSSYRRSREIRIRCEVRNNSSALLDFRGGAPPFVLKLAVKRRDGVVVSPGPIDSNIYLRVTTGFLGPGHFFVLTRDHSEFFELWRWGYDLPPGDYHVTAYWRAQVIHSGRGGFSVERPFWVKSNTIDLTVRPWWSF